MEEKLSSCVQKNTVKFMCYFDVLFFRNQGSNDSVVDRRIGEYVCEHFVSLSPSIGDWPYFYAMAVTTSPKIAVICLSIVL